MKMTGTDTFMATFMHGSSHEAPIMKTFIGYHAIISTGIILKPGFCPFCVWDAFRELFKINEQMH